MARLSRTKVVPHDTPLAGGHGLAYLAYRAMEWLPGVLSWGTLAACVILSFTNPLVAAYLIVLYDFYWLIRITYLLFYIISSWRRYRRAIRVDWFQKLQHEISHWRRFRHVVLLPTYREPYEVVRETFLKLCASRYDLKQVTVVLAGEARAVESFTPIAEQIVQEFGERFEALLVTVHPADLPGEMPGKGSNTRYAGQILKRHVDKRGWDYADVIASAFDIDTWVHPQYLSALTHRYATHPDPTHVSYQPLTLYHNNVWSSDALTRAVSNSTTFWLLTDLARSERLFTFSSHSMPFKALVDVGFWQPDVVSEDSRIFLQCLLHYQGRYEVEPIYVPVSMSTTYMGKFWRSLRNQYLQMRRWAWGVENLPYMVWQFRRGSGRGVPATVKFRHAFNYLEGNFTWATAPLIITVLGRLPFMVAPQEIRQLAFVQNAPIMLHWLLTFSLLSLFVTAVMSTIMLPDEPPKRRPAVILRMILQYPLFLVTMIAFGSVPALDAQLRHILGGRFRLGFWSTEKSKASVG